MDKLLDFFFGGTRWLRKHTGAAYTHGVNIAERAALNKMLNYLDDQDMDDFDTPQELLEDMQSFLRLWKTLSR
jgi:hypothetical protein